LLRLGALGLLLETARRAFSADAMEPAEGILLIVESLTMEANESDISIAQSVFTTNAEAGAGEEARKIVLMFLERLCHPSGAKKSNKQQRNEEMVARILPYLTYGEPAAMEALIQHFEPYLKDWTQFDQLQKQHEENPKDDSISRNASTQRSAVDNFVRVSESLKTSSCGERLKEIILEKGITKAAVEHVKQSFACLGQIGFRTSAEWTSGLKLPSIPPILSMLKGLAKGHLPTQKCIDEEGILQLLHALEGVPGENEIGARAENLLDTLANKENNGDGFLGEKIQELRHATRDEMRRRALQKREMLLQVTPVVSSAAMFVTCFLRFISANISKSNCWVLNSTCTHINGHCISFPLFFYSREWECDKNFLLMEVDALLCLSPQLKVWMMWKKRRMV
jgi:E3 ubiquitin-protein ligase UBR4